MSGDESPKQASDGQQNIIPASLGDTKNETGKRVEARGDSYNKTGTEASNPQKPSRIRVFLDRHFPHAKSHDRWTLLFTCVIAASSALYTLFAGYTLREIRSGSTDTHTLAEAAGKQADHTQAIANAAGNISTASDSFSRSVATIQKQTENAVAELKRTADDSERAIVEASNNAKNATRISERPYITLENIRFDPQFDESKNPLVVKVDLHNSGRTPALKLAKRIDAFLNDVKITSALVFEPDAIVPADRSVTSSYTLRTTAMSLLRLSSGADKLFLKGDVIYGDIFKDSHQTTVCAVWDPTDKIWKFCPGNDVE
jgi:hypothetical protein